MTASGRRAGHAEAVLAAVVACPGMTAPEVGDMTGLGHVEAQRRLSDLTRLGRVRHGPPVAVPGRRAMVTWWPATATEGEQTDREPAAEPDPRK